MKKHILALLFFSIVLVGSRAQFAEPAKQDLSDDAPVVQTDTLRVPFDATEADIHRADVALRLQKVLNKADAGRCLVSMQVFDLTDSCYVFSHQPYQTMRPASNQKIITAVTALSVIGSEYQLVTPLRLSGDVVGKSLLGNVYLRGAFDPLLSAADLNSLAASVHEAGVDTVCGDLVFDISMKDTLRAGWGWCWDDDNPVLSPLLMEGGKCYDAMFPALLQQAGVTVLGKVCYAAAPADARQLSEIRHKLTDVLRPMMKDSDNQMAEVLFYHTAASKGKPYASRKDAVAFTEQIMKSCGLAPADYIVADGSGLSLYNYTTADGMLTLLRYAYQNEQIYSALLQSLPIAAVDGTLSKRMKGTVAASRVQAKTGTVKGVSTLSGYADAADGHRYAFSILVSGTLSSKPARDLQDSLCVEMCR